MIHGTNLIDWGSNDFTDDDVDQRLAALSESDKSAVRRLWLNGNEMTRVPPALLAPEFAALTQLSLNWNDLPQLPPEIALLKRLKKLYVEHTGLTSLPREINSMTRLDSLFINENNLGSVPPLTSLTLLGCLWLGCGGATINALHAVVLTVCAVRIPDCPRRSQSISATSTSTTMRSAAAVSKCKRTY